MYSEDFKQLVNYAHSKSDDIYKKREANPYYIGFGNPNADILIIGKEKGFDSNSKDQLSRESTFNPLQWLNKIEYGSSNDEFDPEMPYGNHLGDSSGHTWRKYQKLNDYIFGERNFKNNFFITEWNYAPSKYSPGHHSVQDAISERLVMFERPYFKSQFKVIILGSGGYVKPEQFCKTFECGYDGDEKGKHVFNTGNWFFTHHTVDQQKLIIHTRQLSMNVQNEMLESMASEIKNHLAL